MQESIGSRRHSRLRPGFQRVQVEALVAAYRRLRVAGIGHVAALAALGEWLVLVVLVADFSTGAIDPGGQHPGDRRGYKHRLLSPTTWKSTRRQLVAAGLLIVDAKGRVVGIDPVMFRALEATTDLDGEARPFVPLNRSAVRDLRDELRDRPRDRARLFATLVLLAGHTNEQGSVIASERELAGKLGISPSQAHRTVRLAVEAGYVATSERGVRTNQHLDTARLPFMREVRDRLNGRTWSVQAVVEMADEPADRAPDRCSDFAPHSAAFGAPASPPASREGSPRETYNPRVVIRATRETRPDAEQQGVRDEQPSGSPVGRARQWQPGPSSTHLSPTRTAVAWFAANAETVLATLRTAAANRPEHLRPACAVIAAMESGLHLLRRWEGAERLDADARDYVDLAARVARRVERLLFEGLEPEVLAQLVDPWSGINDPAAVLRAFYTRLTPEWQRIDPARRRAPRRDTPTIDVSALVSDLASSFDPLRPPGAPQKPLEP